MGVSFQLPLIGQDEKRGQGRGISVDETGELEGGNRGDGEEGAARIENEGKANNGVFSFCAHVGGNNRRLSAAPLISGMVKLNPRVEFIRFYWERGRRKSKFTEGGLGAPEKSGGKRRRRRRTKGKKKRGTG